MPKPSSAAILLPVFLLIVSVSNAQTNNTAYQQAGATSPKIQVAILLDVSGSMMGLIEQAKNQLWNMVGVLANVRCDSKTPDIEIALYEYGRTTNLNSNGYIKQISPFTKDLDLLFRQLKNLFTNGSEEYCGHVLYNSLTQLQWDSSSRSYKVIFIAGNESFLQGSIPFQKACDTAKRKGVIINTIYCGSREKGIEENWNLGTECGNGRFTNIDQDGKDIYIPTPYDSTIIALKGSFNNTYIPYGENGISGYTDMNNNDTVVQSNVNDPNIITKYIVVKTNKSLFENSGWDLVDTLKKDSSFIHKLDMQSIPDSLKKMSREELKKYVLKKGAERAAIIQAINELKTQQNQFIARERQKHYSTSPQTLGSEIELIIREQITRVGMYVSE